jgi:hypothetical protein
VAELARDPREWELEDLVSAHLAARGCYVETSVKEKNPDELLELDIVWTDYRKEHEEPHPVEVKSGDWGVGEVFKFYGWTQYLRLKPGEFIYKEHCGRLDRASLEHIHERTGINFLHVPKPAEDVDTHFKVIGLPEPPWKELPGLWRFSYWARRRLMLSLNIAIQQNVCPASARAVKEYHWLVNNAVFFIPDVRDRIEKLLVAHFDHQELASSAAYEIESGNADFHNPPQTRTFKRACYWGEHFPIQACLYVEHRARLYILKALVDYWLAKQRGETETKRRGSSKLSEKVAMWPLSRLTSAMTKGLEELSATESFRLFPVFWQVFLWSWGGFLMRDCLEEEYAALQEETGVPAAEIPTALSAFDKIFPTANGWFREPDSRKVLILMPPAMRGLGAHRRKLLRGVENYKELRSCSDATKGRMADDHNTVVRLLECPKSELVK